MHRITDWTELTGCRPFPLVTGSQSQKGAIAAPERHDLRNCKQASLLTKTSWDSGQSTSTWEGAPVVHPENQAAGTAAKSPQSCPTLCDPTDGSPPGSPIPGILQQGWDYQIIMPFSWILWILDTIYCLLIVFVMEVLKGLWHLG